MLVIMEQICRIESMWGVVKLHTASTKHRFSHPNRIKALSALRLSLRCSLHRSLIAIQFIPQYIRSCVLICLSELAPKGTIASDY